MVNITLEKVNNGFVVDVHFNRSSNNLRLVFEKAEDAKATLIEYFDLLGTTIPDENN